MSFQARPLFLESLDVHRIEWVVVFAYFDETGTEGGNERLTAVAGYLFDKTGAERFWDAYEANVEPLLPVNPKGKQVGKKVFHASHCILGHEAYKGMKEDAREEIVNQLVLAINQSVIIGSVVAVEPGDYADGIAGKGGFSALINGQKVSLDPWVGSKYSACLMQCVQQINSWMDGQKIDGEIEYIFESGCDHQLEANGMMELVKKSPELTRRYRLKKHSFMCKGPDVPWLAPPDLLVWEWQRADLNAKEQYRKEWRMTLAELADAKPLAVRYMTPQSIGIHALVNAFYRVKLS